MMLILFFSLLIPLLFWKYSFKVAIVVSSVMLFSTFAFIAVMSNKFQTTGISSYYVWVIIFSYVVTFIVALLITESGKELKSNSLKLAGQILISINIVSLVAGISFFIYISEIFKNLL